ncbi:MAG: hypothetical protein GX244_02145 [Firmicutes bacterium]|nr:hypothetical protein [Bacillota bacterium]
MSRILLAGRANTITSPVTSVTVILVGSGVGTGVGAETGSLFRKIFP